MINNNDLCKREIIYIQHLKPALDRLSLNEL